MVVLSPLNNIFDEKQSRDVVDCPASCYRRSKLCTFAFRFREVRWLLSELDPHGGVDPLEFVPMFTKELSSVLAHKVSMVFQRLLSERLFSILSGVVLMSYRFLRESCPFYCPDLDRYQLHQSCRRFMNVWSPLACVLLLRVRVSFPGINMPIVRDWELVMPCWT